MSRSYQLKRRAEHQDQTRQRIIEATIELHQTIGPKATTVSEIAERAQVGRVTVYRHFPAADVLTKPWRERGRRRTLLRAGIAVALSFDTWRTLTREQQLTDQQALELMLRLTCDCAGDQHKRTNNAARVKR